MYDERERFFKGYPIGELFTVKGELVIVKGYNNSMAMAIVEDEDGKTINVPIGLMRKI